MKRFITAAMIAWVLTLAMVASAVPHRMPSDLARAMFPASWSGMDTLNHGKMLGWGTTVPADASTGYGKGCVFIHTDGADLGDLVYVNVGTTSSSNFDAVESDLMGAVTPGTVTASKACVVDADKKLGDFAQVTLAQDNTTDGVVDVLVLGHSSSDDNATIADGVGISMKLENAAGTATYEEWASLDVVSTTITNGSEDGDIVLKAMLAGTVTEALRLDASDQSLTCGRNATDANGVYRLRLFPVTASKGSLVLAATANTGDTALTVTNLAQAGANTAQIPNVGSGATDQFVLEDVTQTLTNKTLTSPTITTMLVDDSDAGITVTSANQTNASPTATIPDIGDAADSFVMNDTAATLTNKTLTSPVVGTQITLDQTTHDVTLSWADQTQACALGIPDMNSANAYMVWTTESDGQITNAEIDAAAAIVRSKLAQEALESYPIPLAEFRAADGAALGIADVNDAGDHYLAYSTNTWKLMGNSPDSDTQTDVSLIQFALPPEYDDGQTITVRINAEYTADGDTKSLDLEVYKANKTDASVGSDICATAVQTLTATDAAYDFTVTPTGLTGGDLLNIKITTAFQDSDGAVGEAEINSVEVLLDIKG